MIKGDRVKFGRHYYFKLYRFFESRARARKEGQRLKRTFKMHYRVVRRKDKKGYYLYTRN